MKVFFKSLTTKEVGNGYQPLKIYLENHVLQSDRIRICFILQNGFPIPKNYLGGKGGYAKTP